MIHKVCLLLLVVLLFNCVGKTEKKIDSPFTPKATGDTIKLHRLKKLSVVGNFDNDRQQDTIYQHNYSKLTRSEIENSPDPDENEWETITEWFYSQDADVYLTVNKNMSDTLHLGPAQGLYCLINIGDHNADGKDEIALVVDLCDMSRVNSCGIYTLCQNKWTLLKQFKIHEGSFDYIDGKPEFYTIRDYLEKRNGKWVYMDYLQAMEYPDHVQGMKELDLDACQ